MTDMPPYLATKDEDKSKGQNDSDSSDIDDWDLPLSFDKPRHLEPIRSAERVEHSWRVKEKYKTHCVALVLCLNVGVDPPDVVKTQPCARLECWIDPCSMSPSKALESIGHSLQAQYERWQPRARYKQSLDPTSDEVKKLCCSLRRNAKDERVLFHYNGHGVPRPTAQGEIWVFNRAYTQYIPLSMYDLQTWMGAPSLYVYDCSNAGVILDNFRIFADQHERDYEMQVNSAGAGADGATAATAGSTATATATTATAGGAPAAAVCYRNCIQLAACAAGQALPMNPELPADLFTACLTTPVKMAMKWFVLRNRTRVAPANINELIDKIPGQVTDRRTMLGELNWIFTAITDTIAWSSLPPDLFQQLFRADLLTASLCRNFLLADRIMRSYNCTPVSQPALPSLARHPLWAAWEQTLDLALAQLPGLLTPAPAAPPAAAAAAPPAAPAPPAPAPHYRHSPFFRDQLTAFQVWLDLGAEGGDGRGVGLSRRRAPPEQLPMVLQVLLSTLHRVRALQILSRFLALGPWAVRAVLHVGIFPYMLKLLQAAAHDLRASMVYIWANIIAVDPSCQVDLVNAKGHKYFLAVLADPSVDTSVRTLSAFVLAGVVDGFPGGQQALLQGGLLAVCLEQLPCKDARLRQWACLALGRLWRRYDAARWAGVRDLAHEKLFPLLSAAEPETRAACAWALGAFVAAGAHGAQAAARSEHANALDQTVGVQLAARAANDASPLVRAELLAALQWPVLVFEQHFIAVCLQERARRHDARRRDRDRDRDHRPLRVDPGQDALAPRATRGAALALPQIGFGSVYMKLWETLTSLAAEPHPQISQMAQDIIAYIAAQVDAVGREPEPRPRVDGGCNSLPPSPNTRPEPPPHHTHTLPAGRRGKPASNTAPASSSTTSASATDDSLPRDRDRDSVGGGAYVGKQPIVSTQFVEWATAQFAREALRGGGASGTESGAGGAGEGDSESPLHHSAAWRFSRNRSLRRHARLLRRVGSRAPRPDHQAFHYRCPLPPAVVLFHPYEQHAAVASKDNFGIWDWGTAAKLCVGAWRKPWGRITSLAYLNAHHHALLAVASHTGNLAIYRPSGSSTEPALVSAWRALRVRPAPDARPPPAQPLYSLAQLVQEQFAAADERQAAARNATPHHHPDHPGSGGGSPGGAGGWAWPAPGALVRWSGARRSLALAGAAPIVRLWDASTEMLAADIRTETEAATTALWRGSGAVSLVAGFADGALAAWDERAPRPLFRLHDHCAPLLAAAAREDVHTLVTACTDGTVRLYDTRQISSGAGGGPRATVRAPGPLAAVDVHPLANLLACGSINQCISIYDLEGAALNTIKFHEGFMGARIGPVSCLTFHPLRVAMGVGTKDATVSVYVSEARR